MDLEARRRWFDYSVAKDRMFAATDTAESPWWSVDADSKKGPEPLPTPSHTAR